MEDLRWGYGVPANIVEPPSTKKGNGWNGAEPAAAQFLNWWMNNAGEQIGAIPGLLNGLTLSNNATVPLDEIDIAAGRAMDSAGLKRLDLAATLTKQLGTAWAEGDGAGGNFNGSKTNDTWYHLFLIRKDDDVTIDAGFDTSATSPSLPAGWSSYRRLGSVLTDDQDDILGFSQEGDEFLWDTVIGEFNTSVTVTTGILQALTVPPVLMVQAIVDIGLEISSGINRALVTSPNQSDVDPNLGYVSLVTEKYASSRFIISTDSSRQIRYRLGTTAGSPVVNGTLIGWIDRRDR